MSGVEIRQRAASDGQRGSKRGGLPLYIGLAGALLTNNIVSNNRAQYFLAEKSALSEATD